jgi:hypothetical protein
MQEPYVRGALSSIISPRYSLHLRPLFEGVKGGTPPASVPVMQGPIAGEIVLSSTERIPVEVLGIDRVLPSPHVVETELWMPGDEYFSIDASLTQSKRGEPATSSSLFPLA